MVILRTIRLPEFDKLPDTTESAEEQKSNPRKIPATTEGADKKQILENYENGQVVHF